MPVLPQRAFVRLAVTPRDFAQIAEHPLGTEWPPPGTHIVNPWTPDTAPAYEEPNPHIPLNALLSQVVADAGLLPQDGFWWASLGQLFAAVPGWELRYGARLLEWITEVSLGPVGTIAAVPVYFRGGEGIFMRWIRCTFRGELGGGVEQFQHKLDLGNPGDDPDLDEGDCAALAEQLATGFTGAFNDAFTFISTEVDYTEVGCVTMTATTGTDSHGDGGNMEQSFPTEWFLYPTGLAPGGAASGNALPYEVACAVTLQTDKRGPSGRGRFYVPPLAVSSMGSGGLFSEAARTGILGGASDFLNWIKAQTPYVPVVVSPRRIVLNTVRSVNVGIVPDSQRRRRRSQDEARTQIVLD